ncbi:hypothetical protein LSCM1_03722 [Leishmania martiniquensis]|uniref:Uncharacterized protein n=1 Tax=Leishmania martiniquensis TaxID=1580590 RepID=A0A836GZ29_9TRYP|nr:hypothetical protein LSCM1_03722 [Leishmania martiniquensis]
MPALLPHRVVEDCLLQGAHLPEALYAVVGLVWFSLVNGARDAPAGEVVATANTTPEAETEAASPAAPLASASRAGDTRDPRSGVSDIAEVTLDALLRQATADHAVSTADVDAWASTALRSFVGDCDASLIAPLVTMLPAAPQAGAPAAISETRSEASASCMSRRVLVVELSPLILRVLLWWAGRPQLPSRRSGHAAKAAQHDAVSNRVDSGSMEGERASKPPASSSGKLNPSSSEDGANVDVPPPPLQADALHSHQLRLRIADIFVLLCRGGGGVVVSDALLYGRCHDASELAAQRCHLVFSGFSDARWRVATTWTSTSTARFSDTVDLGSIEAFTPLGGGGDGSGARGGTYDASEVLGALMDLHLSVASATHHSHPGPSLRLTSDTSVESDAVATGALLRALLRCPALNKRVMRLFSGDARAAKSRRLRRGGSALVKMPPSAASENASQELVSPSLSTAPLNVAGARRQLDFFLPALTHPSPIVSSESWKTLTVLLFPFSVATVSSATRRLLLSTPACPVQRLLAAALALPGDDNNGTSTQQPGSHLPSHPMARNNALRLLHVLCTSTDLPPAVQLLFYQCPALLWRVLRLAAAACQGIPAAHVGLVRRVLADYVMLSARQPESCAGGSADLLSSASVTTQRLLRDNKTAVARFLASTCAVWGGVGGSIAPEDAGGDLAGAASENGYDEGHVMAALHAL